MGARFYFSQRAVIVLVLISLTSPLLAAENVQTGRYSELTTTATPAQLWPLANIVSVSYHPGTQISNAVKEVLTAAGYQLHPNVWSDPTLSRLLNLTIPEVHQRFEQMAVQEILHALVGSSLDVLVDPVKRYVSFAPSGASISE
jgi:conjugative transfer region protein (TIGR03748 family)